MMMPNPSSQRNLWRARLDRYGNLTDHRVATDARPTRVPGADQPDHTLARAAGWHSAGGIGLRVQAGHALIAVGTWLSGERRERSHRTA